MGNNSTKETRGSEFPSNHGNHEIFGTSSQPTSPADRNHTHGHSSRSGHGNRSDLFFLESGTNSNHTGSDRRETKQEREARKLEKEKLARIKERERSLAEESVDGGFLVTMGIYTGFEDFNKAIVRQLMIERRIAPFWRGLNEYSESWTEHQLIAAGRGFPIPAADEILENEPLKFLRSSNYSSGLKLQSSQDPGSTDLKLVMSNELCQLSEQNDTLLNDDLSSQSATFSPGHPLPFRPRSKTLGSLSNTSPYQSSPNIVPREITLTKDPYATSQAIEVYLYRDVIECPICFLSYPPYLNKTRCCDQPVCSECFVQIKRPDPHPPELHYSPNQIPQGPEAEAESLVSEPACCPYCQQPDFGVTYEPPNIPRDIVYANKTYENTLSTHPIPPLSYSDSLNITPQSPSLSSSRRRVTSVSANAPTVITTDRIRPDWAVKLANARAHLARRSAAATALHAAAYLMGNGNSDSRGFNFRPGRLNRGLCGDSSNNDGSIAPTQFVHENSRPQSDQPSQSREDSNPNEMTSRRNRIQDIEELMMMEAIRLSLAAEEERKKKAGKEAVKEAKKKAKEEKKREKKEKKCVYGGAANSASGSSLSLNLPGLGRRRGSSLASTLFRDVAHDDSEVSNLKGKGVDRRPASFSDSSAPIDFSRSMTSHWNLPGVRPLDNVHLAAVDENYGVSPCVSDKETQDHQIRKASSSESSLGGSIPNSPRHSFNRYGSSSSVDSRYLTGTNMVSQSTETPKASENSGGTESESLINFQSLAAMVLHQDDVNLDKVSSSFHIEDIDQPRNDSKSNRNLNSSTRTYMGDTAALQQNETAASPNCLIMAQTENPEVIITPGSPRKIINGHEGKEFEKTPG